MPAVLLVMRRVFFRTGDEFLVDRVHHPAFDAHDHRLVALVADHYALQYASRHYRSFLRRFAAPLAEDGLDAGDVASHLAHPRGVLQLSVCALKTQIENFLTEHVDLTRKLVIGLGPDITCLHAVASSPSRTIKRVARGNFAAASANASRAVSAGTPSSSNMMRPGLTRQIQYSGEPLPLPMRTSAGLVDTGTSGKMRIHTRPARRICRVIARRAASIWRAVIRSGSIAFRPYAPKLRLVPPLARPWMRPLWALRNFVRFGESIFSD